MGLDLTLVDEHCNVVGHVPPFTLADFQRALASIPDNEPPALSGTGTLTVLDVTEAQPSEGLAQRT